MSRRDEGVTLDSSVTNVIATIFVGIFLLPAFCFVMFRWGELAINSEFMPSWGNVFLKYSFIMILLASLYKRLKGRKMSVKNTLLPIIAPPIFAILIIGGIEIFAVPSTPNQESHLDLAITALSETLAKFSLVVAWGAGLLYALISD